MGVPGGDTTDVRVVGAPMAGGASTPELVAAVNGAGGLGFLAAGYLSAEAMTHQIRRTRGLTPAPFGVNVFVPGPDRADPGAVAAYADRLSGEADRLGVRLGAARWTDDDYPAKLDALVADPVAVVSFTFHCPAPRDIQMLRGAGSAVLVTVTTPQEARHAVDAGADGVCVQGAEAGGHQGSFDDTNERVTPLLDLLAGVGAEVAGRVPMVAAGGVTSGAGVRRTLEAGASAVQVGTVLLRVPESGASATHRDALADTRLATTAVTRAFSGRRARGVANRFLRAHDGAAPGAYPQVHHLTGPVRAAAARDGDSSALHLWAGTGFRAATDHPAAAIVTALASHV